MIIASGAASRSAYAFALINGISISLGVLEYFSHEYTPVCRTPRHLNDSERQTNVPPRA